MSIFTVFTVLVNKICVDHLIYISFDFTGLGFEFLNMSVMSDERFLEIAELVPQLSISKGETAKGTSQITSGSRRLTEDDSSPEEIRESLMQDSIPELVDPEMSARFADYVADTTRNFQSFLDDPTSSDDARRLREFLLRRVNENSLAAGISLENREQKRRLGDFAQLVRRLLAKIAENKLPSLPEKLPPLPEITAEGCVAREDEIERMLEIWMTLQGIERQPKNLRNVVLEGRK